MGVKSGVCDLWVGKVGQVCCMHLGMGPVSLDGVRWEKLRVCLFDRQNDTPTGKLCFAGPGALWISFGPVGCSCREWGREREKVSEHGYDDNDGVNCRFSFFTLEIRARLHACRLTIAHLFCRHPLSLTIVDFAVYVYVYVWRCRSIHTR